MRIITLLQGKLQPLCNVSDYNVAMKFSAWLRQKRKDADLTLKDVAKRTGLSFSYISTLERNQPHSLTGKLIVPTRDKVVKIAKAVEGDINEALYAAGYAPATATRKPTTIPELVAALESLGIETPMLHGGFPKDEDGEGFREIVERIWLDIQLVTSRINKGR